jgi:hypothetical protein
LHCFEQVALLWTGCIVLNRLHCFEQVALFWMGCIVWNRLHCLWLEIHCFKLVA